MWRGCVFESVWLRGWVCDCVGVGVCIHKSINKIFRMCVCVGGGTCIAVCVQRQFDPWLCKYNLSLNSCECWVFDCCVHLLIVTDSEHDHSIWSSMDRTLPQSEDLVEIVKLKTICVVTVQKPLKQQITCDLIIFITDPTHYLSQSVVNVSRYDVIFVNFNLHLLLLLSSQVLLHLPHAGYAPFLITGHRHSGV